MYNRGNFVAASCAYLPHVASAAMAEALAMKEGLHLAQVLCVNRVIVKSDSLETIIAYDGNTQWWNDAATISPYISALVLSVRKVEFVIV